MTRLAQDWHTGGRPPRSLPEQPDLPDSLDALPPYVGQRTRQLRKLRGLTQQELADLAGLSFSLVNKVEAGRRPATPTFVTATARALRVPVGRLLAQPDPEAGDEQRATHAGVEPVRLELLRYRLPVDPGHAVRPPAQLAADVDRGLRLRHGCRLAELGGLLPGLLVELRATAQRTGDAGAYRLLAFGYDLAVVYAGQLSQVDLGVIACDRLAWAAERAGDPLLRHLADWRSGMHLLYSGDYLAVQQLTGASFAELEPVLAGTTEAPAVSLWGQMHLQAALAAVRAGRTAVGEDHLGEARDAARRLGGDRDDFGLAFGPTNVALWAVSLALSANDAPRALALAEDVRFPAGMQVIRRADYYIDVAGACLLNGSYDASLDALVAARRTSPESTRARPIVREIVAQLIRARRRLPDSLRRYASWAGLSD